MAKHQFNVRISQHTQRQIDRLHLALGLSKTEVLIMAVDRMYQTELGKAPKRPDPLAGLPTAVERRRDARP